MAYPQRPPPRTRSSTALSSSSASSSLPGSPGPSVSIRDAQSATPSLSARNSPRPGYLTARTTSMTSSASNAGPSTSKTARPGHARDRSTSNFSVATSSASTRTAAHHNRRQQTLMGGNPNSKLSRSHLASYNSAAAMDRSNSGMTSPPVPDILINGAERPEDVDVGSIGRLPSLSAASPVRSSPEATSIGVDGLFAKFGVKEVRSIAQRGRAKAESKREELRNMVGERYRDLLGAADSIVRMRKSSSVLLERLAKARQECDREVMLSKAVEEDMTRSQMLSRATTPLVRGHTPYSIATLVKLLLDCPEHIWRCIERQDYLSAARLDSTGRAVYRELVNAGKRKATPKPRRRSADTEEDDEDSGGYDSDEDDDESGDLLAAFPLVEQQFDTLDSLAPQISSRASSHLQLWDLTVSNVAEALATLVMLDRISVTDGLALLLEQRRKTLAALMQDSSSSTTSSLRRPSALATTTLLSRTGSQSGEDKPLSDAVQRTTEALLLIMATHEHAMQCFASAGQNDEPRLLHLLRLVQESTTSSADSPNTTLSMINTRKSTSHANTSHLQPILATLPNAHLFLRYLPEQILTFTPYIDIDSAESQSSIQHVRDKLDLWFTNALQTFETGVARLFSAITSASQLADARGTIRDSLAKQANESNVLLKERAASLELALDAALGRRFIDIYTRELATIEQNVSEALEGSLRALETSSEDLHANAFLFSASLSFPSSTLFPSTSLNALAVSSVDKVTRTDPFMLYKQAIEVRVSGRSPVLYDCLARLESLALETKEDILAWLNATGDSAAKAAYSAAVKQSLSTIENGFQEKLAKQDRISSQLFLGSIAARLALDSTFVQSLLLLPESQDPPDDNKHNLLGFEESSRQHWREVSVRKAADFLRTSLLDQLDFPSPAKPGCVFDTFGLLANAAAELGPHRGRAIPTGIQELLQDFQQVLLTTVLDEDFLKQVQAVSKTQRPKLVLQLQADIALLREVIAAGLGQSRNGAVEQWDHLEKSLTEISGGSRDSQDLKSRDVFLRSQNLLAPLLLASSHWTEADTEEVRSLLLPFGTPSTTTASEGMLEVAKPGPRLALLPVNATAA